MYESKKYYWKSTNGDLTPVHELKDLHICNIVMKHGEVGE